VALVSLWYVRKSTLAAVTSASASETSAQTAQDVLAEARRRYIASIAPHVTVEVAKLTRSSQQRTPTSLRNAGPGTAVNVRYEVTIKPQGGTPNPIKGFVPVLAAAVPCEIHGTFSQFHPSLVSAALTYHDIDGGKHWSRYNPGTGDWSFDEAAPPKPEQTDQDA